MNSYIACPPRSCGLSGNWRRFYLKNIIVLILAVLTFALAAEPGFTQRKRHRVLDPGAYIKTAKIEILSADIKRYEYAIIMLDSLFLNHGPHAEGYYWMGQIMVDLIEKTSDLKGKLSYVRKLVTYADSLRYTCDNKDIKKKYRKKCAKFSEEIDSTQVMYWQTFYNNGVDQLKEIDRTIDELAGVVDDETRNFYDEQMAAMIDSCVDNMTMTIMLDSTDTSPYIALGSLYEKIDSIDTAIDWLKRGLDKIEDKTKLLLPIAYNYIRKEEYCGAIPYFRDYVDIKTDDIATTFNLSISYNNCEMYDSARVMLNRILALDSLYVKAWTGIGDYFSERARQAFDSSNSARESGDDAGQEKWKNRRSDFTDSALTYFGQAFTLEPDNLSHAEKYGLFAYLDQDFEAASRAYTKAVEIDPSIVDNWKTLGDTYINLQDFPNATSAYEKVIELTPGDAEVWRQLADLYDAINEPVKKAEAEKKIKELQ